jgi:HAD superfamily hydrolase (TIGR01509 family)
VIAEIEASGNALRFKAVLFDMDGVLVNSEDVIAHASQMMFKEWYGLDVPRQAFYPFVGAGEDRFLGGVAESYGVAIDLPKAKARVYEHYDALASDHITILPGGREYPEACKDRGILIALASAADRAKVLINLRVLELGETFFDVLITGSEVQKKKPDPEIYLLAAKRLGVAPEECLVIEDAVNGIVSGLAAGSSCLGITSSFDDSTLKAAGALWCFPDLLRTPFPWDLKRKHA